MIDMNSFTEEELAIAKSVDLVEVARSLGYTPKRIGRYYTLKEMDSMRIYNHSHWCRFSRRYEKGESGGSQIDFLKVFAGMDVKEAVFWLLDFAGYRRGTVDNVRPVLKNQVRPALDTRKMFVLPQQATDNSYLYSYLTNERYIGRDIVDYMLRLGIIYESMPYHNIVFKGVDKAGRVRFASMRGVFDKQGKSFKCDVAGNDKRYGVNIANPDSDELIVFEAAIDMMSYMDIFRDFDSNMLALGMVCDTPLETFLDEHSGIKKIKLCLDNDEPGRTASRNMLTKYVSKGYEVIDIPPPEGCKDYNEWLQRAKMTYEKRHMENQCENEKTH